MGFDPGIEPGAELSHSELTQRFQCQQGKGMRCSRATNSLVLVVDHTHKHSISIYADEWDDAGVMHYRGTGLRGDQSLKYEGNRWLRDAEKNGTGVFLFEKEQSGRFLFRGTARLADEPYRRREPDADGEMRWVWVFPLSLASEPARQAGDEIASPEPPLTAPARLVALPELADDAAFDEPEEHEGVGLTHEAVQWCLLEMGASLGLDVWVARNDRSKSFGEHVFQDAPRLRDSLPHQFEAQVMKLVEHIDVLWLRGNKVEAAFEIEHTTAVYSGLLRMSDLVTMSPNIMIRLFIVAPDVRRAKVFAELTRPTFDALEPPLRNVCGYISYSHLFEEAEMVRRYRDQLKPGFLNGIAEFAPALDEGFRSA